MLATASFRHANLVNAEFLACNATGADYSQADAVAGIWRNADLRKSRWTSAELKLASFVECQATEMVDFPDEADFVAARCEGIAAHRCPNKRHARSMKVIQAGSLPPHSALTVSASFPLLTTAPSKSGTRKPGSAS